MAMLWATYHGKRLVNSHGGFALPNWRGWSLPPTRDAERLASAIRPIYPVRYVLVHPNLGSVGPGSPSGAHAGQFVPTLALAHTFGPMSCTA
jgi:hypothetical protein